MKFSYLLIAFLFLVINGCSDFSSEANEFELSGKMYACDESVHGDIANDTKTGKKQYCNGLRWIDLIPEDSTVQNVSNTQIMYECKNGEVVKFKNLCSEQPSDYLPLDDTEYPYAGIPRIVIETENHRDIRDRETEIPAKLQIWGENAPESEIMELTIRGRGNSSWDAMPKKSYKIEFLKKQEMLGMHKDKDWALIANYADKTLLKNYISYKLSLWLGAEFTPNSKFAELFLNHNYQGVYLLTETLKISTSRIKQNSNQTLFFAEFDIHHKRNDQTFFLSNPSKPITIHFPKNATDSVISILKGHLDSLNNYTRNGLINKNTIHNWIDLESYFLYYWVQEFAENRDANFDTSVFFTWEIGKPLKMGPLWDFDLGYNGHPNSLTQDPQKWFIRNYYWNYFFFKQKFFEEKSTAYWKKHEQAFQQTVDSLHMYSSYLTKAAENNFKRWPILKNSTSLFLVHSYDSYQAAVDSLYSWMEKRFNWIQNNLQ